MPMKNLSIRTILGVIIGVLGLLLVAVSVKSLQEALERSQAAQRVAALAPISQSFFLSLQQHRLERGNVIIAMRSKDPAEDTARKNVVDYGAMAKKGFQDGYAGFSALAASLPGSGPILTRLKESHDAVDALRPKAQAAMAAAEAQRDAQAMRDWPRVTQAYLDAVEAASDYLEASLKMVDPMVDQLLMVKRTAWVARNYAGSMVLRLLGSMTGGQPWTATDIAAHAEDFGRLLTAWSIITEAAARNDTPPAVAEAANKTRAVFQGPMADERQKVVMALATGQKPDIPQAEFQPRQVEGLSLINEIANQALEQLILRAEDQKELAQRRLIISGVLLALAVAVTAIGFLIVQWRVSGPISGMTEAMQRLAERDLDTTIPFVERGAEIGRMAKALQVFKDNMVAREQAEADIARQREETERRRQELEASEKAAGEEIATLVNQVGQGDLSGRISESGKSGFFLSTSQELNRLVVTLQTMSEELASTMGAMADGDLRPRVKGDYRGVFGEIKHGVNSMADQMRDFAGRLTMTAQSVRTASDEISTGSQDLAQRTESQAASIEETAASMHEITTTVKQNADNAQAANQLATTARDTAETGGKVVNDAVSAVTQIEESARKISDIVGLIDEIAFQTNLLALNASVEAARAGEAGKGFAVVAQEVRALAQRSANASKDIKALIQASNAQVKTGANLVNQTGKSLTDIVSAIKKVSDIVAEIAAASREQATGLEQINTAVGSMDEMTQRNAALVEETTAAAQSLAGQARELAQLVGFFKLDETTATAPVSAAAPVMAKPMAPAAPKLAPIAAKPAAKPIPPKPAAPIAKPAAAPKPVPKAADDDDWQEF
jgi:methyl-accepting chemotaxis protein